MFIHSFCSLATMNQIYGVHSEWTNKHKLLWEVFYLWFSTFINSEGPQAKIWNSMQIATSYYCKVICSGTENESWTL